MNVLQLQPQVMCRVTPMKKEWFFVTRIVQETRFEKIDRSLLMFHKINNYAEAITIKFTLIKSVRERG